MIANKEAFKRDQGFFAEKGTTIKYHRLTGERKRTEQKKRKKARVS